MTLTSGLSDALGVDDAGLRLILAQLLAYPIFLTHSNFLKKSPACVQHLFFVISGMFLAYWSIGYMCLVHGCITILTSWANFKIFKGSLSSTLFLYIFHLLYLGAGYYYQPTDVYINWTMPQCVMCLRLIGLSADVYDGTMDFKTLSRDRQETALATVPSLLEIFSHSYFPAATLTGPQFPMKKFQNYVNRNIHEDIEPCISFGCRRLLIGICYLAAHFVGETFVMPTDYLETTEFASLNFFVKSFYFSLWVKFVLSKYIASWLFSEGAMIFSGLAFDGMWEDGRPKWNGGANVKLRVFEGATRFQHIIDSFNINTNGWALSYVYKRLRFLNNKMLSQLGTLVFLAVWHGWESGFYVTFFHEFLVMNFEKGFFPMVDNSPLIQKLNENRSTRNLLWLCGKLYVSFFLPHCFLPFAFLTYDRYLPVMRTTYGLTLVFFGSWPLWRPLAKMILKPQKADKKAE